jgi:hypothetical protein
MSILPLSRGVPRGLRQAHERPTPGQGQGRLDDVFKMSKVPARRESYEVSCCQNTPQCERETSRFD